jgi:hypothetical protein
MTVYNLREHPLTNFIGGYFAIEMEGEIEIWRDVANYNGFYQVSNLGRIKSIERVVRSSKGVKVLKDRIVTGYKSKDGYIHIILSKENIEYKISAHQLVAIVFLGHERKGHDVVVDHINGIKTDNRVCNLRLVTSRENTSICYRSDRDSMTSKLPGVFWCKKRNKWRSEIILNKKTFRLGVYDSEISANETYITALNSILNNKFLDYYNSIKPKRSSKFKGVSKIQQTNKWRAYIDIDNKRKHIGVFENELDAAINRDKYISSMYNTIK